MRDTKASCINRTSVSIRKAFLLDQISVSESDQLHTYPSPNSTLTLALYQLTAVGLGEEYVGAQILTMIHLFHQSPYFFACTPNLNA